MYLGGKCKISWSNDDLERVLMFCMCTCSEHLTLWGGGVSKCQDRFLFAIANFEPPSPQKKVKHEIYSLVLNVSWGKMQNFMVKWWFSEVFNVFKSPLPPVNLSGPRGPWQIRVNEITHIITYYKGTQGHISFVSYIRSPSLRILLIFIS